MERSGPEREKSIRIELKSTGFQRKLADVSKREKEEEISRIIWPQSIRPEMERSDGKGKRRRRDSARVRPGDDGSGKTNLTGGIHLSATPRERRAEARRTGPDWAEGKRERGFLAGFRPKAKRRLLKTFFNLNYS
uniref:Uncharacterized protein n=1 Tax=Oryza sativa subsp. japonica TaxID=39947 RepID=Q6Z9T4_ORYSJ|nr:hypothetical protein [Oryza sativa Japonica Group]